MRSVLQVLASVGLTAGPFAFPVLVLAGMAQPVEAVVSVEESAERVAMVLPAPPADSTPLAESKVEPEVEPEVESEVEPEMDALASSPAWSAPNSVVLPSNIDKNPRKSTLTPRKSKKTTSKKSRRCLDQEPGIVKTGSNRYTVDRSVIAPYASPQKAEELAWTAWHTDDHGAVDGFVVKRMRCGSLLRQAGFKNGDVVLAVNGNPITTLFQGFNTWRKVRKDDTFRVKVQRRSGEVEVLRFTLK